MDSKPRVFVTGGCGAIGSKIVRHLKTRGFDVISPSAAFCDVLATQPLATLLKSPYALVINAHGVLGSIGRVGNHDQAWKRAIEVNLIGTYNVCSYAIEAMIKAKKPGLIINLAGGGGMLDAVPNISAYAASKAGIVSLTQTLAAEHEGNIRFNCIFPGAQDSKMWDQFIAAGERSGWIYEKALRCRQENDWVPIENTLEIIDKLINSTETGKIYFARTKCSHSTEK